MPSEKMVTVAWHMPAFARDPEIATLMYDFYRETAKTYDADLIYINTDDSIQFKGKENCRRVMSLEVLTGNLVALAPKSEIKFTDFVPQYPMTLIAGRDDTVNDFSGIPTIGIATPTQYPLWGAVAAGIVLNHYLG